MKEYAKINLDAQFIFPCYHPDGSVDASFDGTANTGSSSPIDVKTVSPNPNSANNNK